MLNCMWSQSPVHLPTQGALPCELQNLCSAPSRVMLCNVMESLLFLNISLTLRCLGRAQTREIQPLETFPCESSSVVSEVQRWGGHTHTNPFSGWPSEATVAAISHYSLCVETPLSVIHTRQDVGC